VLFFLRCVDLTAKLEEMEKELCKQAQIAENLQSQIESVTVVSSAAAVASSAARTSTARAGRHASGPAAGSAVPVRSNSFVSRGAQHEIRNLKNQCDVEANALEAAKARIAELEARLAAKDLSVTEHKRILKSREEEYNWNLDVRH
jgi:DNA repair ATPase RecN